jgi:hypothetical protein
MSMHERHATEACGVLQVGTGGAIATRYGVAFMLPTVSSQPRDGTDCSGKAGWFECDSLWIQRLLED